MLIMKIKTLRSTSGEIEIKAICLFTFYNLSMNEISYVFKFRKTIELEATAKLYIKMITTKNTPFDIE